jgi:hypothetical protein
MLYYTTLYKTIVTLYYYIVYIYKQHYIAILCNYIPMTPHVLHYTTSSYHPRLFPMGVPCYPRPQTESAQSASPAAATLTLLNWLKLC